MEVITLENGISGDRRRKGERSFPGVYGLVDIREPDRIRYVGSSECVAHRLYSHWHSSNPRNKPTPRGDWLRAVRADGSQIAVVVLERGDFGKRQSAERHEAESRHISALAERGQADLNVTLTPVGHANSNDSRGKLMFAENKRLKKELDELRAEFATFRSLVSATRATSSNSCTSCKLRNAEKCNATQLLPLGEVASCTEAGVADDFSDLV